MLKWFVNNRPPSSHGEVITDDPLATINISKLPSEIYAVSRVNPLFKDETDKHKGSGKRSRPQSRNSRQSGSPYHSSSGYSSGTEEINGQRVYIGVKKDQKPVTEFRDDALIVLEQNIEFVKSILVAVRGSSPPSSTKKHLRRASGPSPATLTPIPEGKVDYSIPRPVWPKDDVEDIHQLSETDRSLIIPQDFQPDSIVDEALLAYTNHSYTPSFSPSEQSSSDRNVSSVPPCQAVEHVIRQVTTVGTLNELSDTLYKAIENHQNSYPENILKGLSEAASKSLDITPNSNRSDSSEEALRNLSFSLSQNGRINMMSRGFSNSSTSSGSSTRILRDSTSVRELEQSNANVNELWQHHSTEHLNLPPARPIQESDDDTQPRGTSSSAASSSGFSDLIQTPRSSSASCSPSSKRSEGLVQPPVFVHDDLTAVPNSVRNAMIYGTLCRMNSKNIGNAYEKLLNSESVRNISAGVDILEKESAANEDFSWQTYSGAEVTKGDVRLKSKGEQFCYPSPERPDFTLDVPRAERLLRKIQASKRRRCWCRLITSFLGLVFFLISVMIVSMMITRGQRIFGSL